MSLTTFNNKVIELEKSVKRSKVRAIRKLTRQIEQERKKNADDPRTTRKVNRIIEEIHQIRKLQNKDVVLFAMENPGRIAEVLQKCKPPNDDIKQHALIRVATEKSLQTDTLALKNDDEFAKSWQPLLIMYRSRYEKRLAWKEKSEDFVKIEQALVEQQKELDDIEKKLPEPIKIKKKKTKDKPRVTRPKNAVVYVLDLENKTAEPFGKQPIGNEDEHENKNVKMEEGEEEKEEIKTEPKSTSSSSEAIINDPFFINSQHNITYQKRTTRDKEGTDLDDKAFIEHSYFIDALSSSSNRRDGKGQVAKQKWAHLSLPIRPRPTKTSSSISNGKTQKPKAQEPDNTKPLHPSWEASKQAKTQYCIQKSQAKKIVFNESDDDNT